MTDRPYSVILALPHSQGASSQARTESGTQRYVPSPAEASRQYPAGSR